MAWIESHQALEKHPKMYDLMAYTGWDLDTAVGKLHRFWWWCVDYAEDGDLRKHNDARLGAAVGLNGEQAAMFVKAMVEACWLDRKPYFRVHDWWDYIGKFLQIKYKHTPEKWQRIKHLYETKDNGSKGGSKKGSKTHNQPTDLTNLNQPNLTIGGLPDWLPKESWQAFLEMRKAKKKPPTELAIKLILEKLDKWRQEGHDPKVILNTSTLNSWTDVYKPKPLGGVHEPAGPGKHTGLAGKNYREGTW